MSDVFISHVSEDAKIALEIALELENAGYSTWAYEVHSVPGPSYLIQTGEAVEQAKVVLLIISSRSLGSHQVTREVVRGLESAKPFVPLLRDVSHVEFQTRQPEWRSAVGAATSIQIPEGGVSGIIPRVVTGLEALGIPARGGPDESRVKVIRDGLAHYAGEREEEEPPRVAPDPQPIAAPSARPRKSNLALILSVMAVAVLAGSAFWFTQTKTDGDGPEAAIPPPVDLPQVEAVDISELKQKLILLHDLNDHYIAVVPYWDKNDADYFLFYGNDQTFHAQRVSGGGASGRESFSYTFWEPRVDAGYKGSFYLREEVYKIVCDDRETALATVDKSTTAAILGAASFSAPLWRHYAYAIGRDDDGVYYYVDRTIGDESTLRLFVGPKGNVKQLSLTDSTVDAAGSVLTTTSGRLSIGLEGGKVSEMRWRLDETSLDLTPLDLWQNRSFIYGSLGAYGKRLGTPCDDL